MVNHKSPVLLNPCRAVALIILKGKQFKLGIINLYLYNSIVFFTDIEHMADLFEKEMFLSGI